MKVPQFDLVRQYSEIKDEVSSQIDKVLSSGRVILGENVAELEKEVANYVGTKYAVGVASGSDALLIGLRALGVEPEWIKRNTGFPIKDFGNDSCVDFGNDSCADFGNDNHTHHSEEHLSNDEGSHTHSHPEGASFATEGSPHLTPNTNIPQNECGNTQLHDDIGGSVSNEMVFKSQPFTAELLNSLDAVIILAPHSSFDYEMLVNNAKLIIDTKNALSKYKFNNVSAEIIKL